jgi:hypothetical protein
VCGFGATHHCDCQRFRPGSCGARQNARA